MVGAEDLALDLAGGRLFVSAYDRRAVERAVGERAFIIPEGGVYQVSLGAIEHSEGRLVAVEPLISRDATPGGLRPHGVDYDPIAGEIVFINRAYQKIDGHWRMTTRLERVDVGGAWRHEGMATGFAPVVGRLASADGAVEPHCAANDVLAGAAETLVSYDHAACGWRAAVEDVFGFAHAGLAAERGGPVFAGARFANGIAQSPSGEIALAATREKAISFLRDVGGGFAETRRVELPGGPDNLTVAPDGGILAAVHPSLPWIGAHRRLGLPRAPSRIVKVDPDTLEVSLMYEDLRGDRFPAATVAVETERTLILGSVTAPGLLVCDLPETDQRRAARL